MASTTWRVGGTMTETSVEPHNPDASASIVVAGHICLDVIPELAGALDVRPGGLVVIGPSAVSTGGPVGNVGIALHRLGVPVRLIAKIGDDMFGRELLSILRGYDPALADGMIVVPSETTSYSVIVNPPGIDRTVLHCAGANDTFGFADVPLDRLDGARILHFGYPPIMRRLYSDGGSELFELFAAAHARNLVVSLDTCVPDPTSAAGRVDWVAFFARVLPAVEVFSPSVDELRVMLRVPSLGRIDLAGARALATRALALGPAVFALKLGDQGLYLRTARNGEAFDRVCDRLALDPGEWRDREVLAPCFRARRVAGTNGSGDSTIAGLLTALLRGENPVEAATSANAVGACSVEEPDASSGVPPWTDVAARLAAGWARLPVADGCRGGVAWQVDGQGTLFDPTGEERP
jgi:sugar/nucleoside kinase (ribokinase family)